jgi:hypothetical protein
VRAAWLYTNRFGLEAAQQRMEMTIKRFALHHDHGAKFHKTLTAAWVRLVGYHALCHPVESFGQFISLNGALLDKDLPLRFYSRERLFSQEARATWVEPDKRALPVFRSNG